MTSTKRTAVITAIGALTLGAGLGISSLATGAPTPTPSTTQSAAPTDRPEGRGGHGGGLRGTSASELATKLGVTEAKVTEALNAVRDEQKATDRSATTRPDPTARDAALAKSLAGKLGLDEAKVATALADLRAAHEADHKAAFQTKLDEAVKAGTLTQAEADAVVKAADKGVIGFGGGR